MAARGWANSTVTATGVAAGAGAAQFGLAYGLGIVGWQPVRDAAGESLWLAGLTWALWIAATSTVLGAVYAASKSTALTGAASGSAADRDGDRRRGRAVDLVSRTVLVLAAAIGALITVPLVMLPARAAQRADTFQPEVTAGAYAVVGVIVGLVIAVVAVNVRVIATNIVVSTGWVWILAAVAVVGAVRANRAVGIAQLGAWQFTDRGWFRETLHLPGGFLMLGGALLVGVFAALPADRRGDSRVCVAISGTFGPLLVAAAYLLAAPKLTVRVEQLSSYLFAPYAVVAGLAGSVFVAVLGPLRPRRPGSVAARVSPPAGDTPPATDTAGTTGTARTTGEAELTEWTRTLSVDSPAAHSGSPVPPVAMTGAGPVTTGIDAKSPTATGRATVTESASPTRTQRASPTATQGASPTATQPASPGVPNPRKRRGPGGPRAS